MQKRVLLNILFATFLVLQLLHPMIHGEEEQQMEIHFLNPLGGEIWTGGSRQNISLDLNTSLDPANVTIYIEYGYQGRGPYEIVNLTGETLNYTWDVPEMDIDGVWMIVRAEHHDILAWDIVQIDIDSTEPEHLDHYPYEGDTVFSTEVFTLVFDQRVNMDDISDNYTAFHGNTPVPGTFNSTMINDNFTITFKPATRLTVGTNYRWSIEGAIKDISDPGNTLWINLTVNFNVEESAPQVSVTAPTRDMLIEVGNNTDITWTTDNSQMGPDPISITYSTDGGSTWITIAQDIENNGVYNWSVELAPATDYPVFDAIVNVSCTSISGYVGYAHSSPFKIYDNYLPEVEVLRPFEDTYAVLGYTYRIQWFATDENPLPDRPITISVSTDNETSWKVIAQSIRNTGEYTWEVEGVPAGEAVINVSCKDSHDEVAWAHSPPLTILVENPLSLSITPNKTSFYVQERVNVSWSVPEWAQGDYRLRLMRSIDGVKGANLYDMDSTFNYRNFTVPYELTSNFRFRLEMYDREGVIFFVESHEFEVFPEIVDTTIEQIGEFTFITVKFTNYVAVGHMQRVFTLYRNGERLDISKDDVYSRQSNIIVYITHNLGPGEYQVELNSEGLEDRNFDPRKIGSFTIEEDAGVEMDYWPLLLLAPLAVIMLYLYRGKEKPSSKLPNTHVNIHRK